jgi:hypothetical protein
VSVFEARNAMCIHLFRGRNHALEFAQENLGADYRIKFFDSLGDFLRGKLFDALDENFLGGQVR